MSGDLVQHEDDRDDLTISYMLGFERGKDAAATALTLAQARIRELETALAAADAIRVAQRRYMADRGNEELGKAVGAAVVVFDEIRARQAPKEASE